MGLAVTSFDKAHEPEGVSTMEWGTRTAIDKYRKLHNRVPDVVYDLGAVGKEPMVRLLAHRGVWMLRGGGVSCEEIILSPHFCHSFLFYSHINNSVCQGN